MIRVKFNDPCEISNSPQIAKLESLGKSDGVKFLIYQREVGSGTGTPHLQGYVEFSSTQRMAGGKRILGCGNTIHLERRAGTREQAIKYCEKDESRVDATVPYIFGVRGRLGGQGGRTDLAAVAESARNGATTADMYAAHPVAMIQYTRGINCMMEHYSKKRKQDVTPIVEIYYGFTGTGKTRKVYDDYDTDEIYLMPRPGEDGKLWFDGYHGQKVILLDDFYSWVKYDTLLRLCDRYPMMLPIKGGFIKNATSIYILTSNQDPDKWYKTISDKAAWKRRVTKVLHFWEGNEPTEETEMYKN